MQPLLTIADVAARVSVSTRTLRAWLASGLFPTALVRVGAVHRWHPDQVEAWVRSGGADVGARPRPADRRPRVGGQCRPRRKVQQN